MRRSTALTVIRVFLGIVFVLYGGIKLAGGQFYYGDWTISKDTVGGTFLVWAFFGYSPYYGRFIGLAELVPALLLFVPRTATVGAALLFPVALNVTVMDFAYGFPSVKYMALLYTALLGVLLWSDRAKLLMLLEPTERVAAYRASDAATRSLATRPPLSPLLRRSLLAAGALLVLIAANLAGASLTAGPEKMSAEAVRVRVGLAREPQLVRSRYGGLYGIDRTARVELTVDAARRDTVVVFAHRATGFTPWRIDSIAGLPNAAPDPHG